ncbi:hypothetical protein [Deminuibacter soli]|uniref:Uncharacterized protein n=1 Tax=Deminuibacter soli TaxID=2291815 RepID=A0A3E1NJW4_9BACT|nr:hypothetical protein [Deminuibacter soli]RFM28171.1 hypothetical protein DXN05_11660 [Deminuibacter soli]
MKNLLISFTYNDLAYTAKVLVQKKNDAILYSIVLVENDANYAVKYDTFIFVEAGDGFVLLLLHADNSFDQLDWNIRYEYSEEQVYKSPEGFSLS